MEENNLQNTAKIPITQASPTSGRQGVLGRPKQFLKSLYSNIDLKLTRLVPDKKLRKIIILFLGGFVSFFVLLTLLTAIVSSTRTDSPAGYFLNKPNVTSSSPIPEKPKTKIQESLMGLKTKIENLEFPPGELTTPTIKTGITIE